MTLLAMCAKKAPTKVRKSTFSSYCFYLGSDFKGTVSRLSCSFCFTAITFCYALWNLTLKKKLLLNGKIIASCPTDKFSKHYIKLYEQQK